MVSRQQGMPVSTAPRAPRDEDELTSLHAEGERNFAGATLSGADLAGADLTEAMFDRASLGGADFAGATLIETSFVAARLTRTVFRNAKLWAADLERANLVAADLSSASLVGASLKSADLRDAKLVGTNLSGASLFKACLIGAHMIGADLGGANLLGANLSGVLGMEADLANVKMWQANLSDADFRNASLIGASMIGARVERTNFMGADLAGVDLTEAVLAGAKIDTPADLIGCASRCKIDHATYLASGWDPFALAAWIDAGAELVDRDNFPRAALEFVRARGEGLTLYFRTPLEAFDRYLIDSIIFSVLGVDSLCRAIEVVPLEQRGFVRILAETIPELAAVGEAIHARLWERDDPPHLTGLLRIPNIYESLERLVTRLDRIELRGFAGPDGPDSSTLTIDEDQDRPLTTIKAWDLR